MKICPKCNEELPLTEEFFQWRKRYGGCFENCCKKCKNQMNKKYVEANKSKIRQKQSKKYYDNLKYYKNKISEYRSKNRSKFKLSQKISRAKRRARLRNAEGTFADSDILEKFKAQNGLCFYCYCSIEDKYHIDHIIPLAKGGNNNSSNIALTCAKCNLTKNAKPPMLWIEQTFGSDYLEAWINNHGCTYEC
jgi:CRISPR/Cas system Type II protein with McrA/HNH and RuvC-like nuclease domain